MVSHLTQPGDLLTPDEAAAILNLDVTTVYAKLRARELPYVDLAKRARRIRRCDLEAFIQSRMSGSVPSDCPAAQPPSQTSAPSLSEYWNQSPPAAKKTRRACER